MIEVLYDIDKLHESFLKVKSTSFWKEETQRYELNLVQNLMKLRDSIVSGKYYPTEPRGFFINERGKPRYIESRTVNDRIVQTCIHENILMPCIRPYLIYDNAASIEHRGTDFFRQRLEYHLTQFAKEYGTNGYILLIDFKKFFDNIWFSVFIDMISKVVPDPAAVNFIAMIVYAGKIDVSYMTDEEYANCMYVPFNNLEYRIAVRENRIKCTKEKFMYKGLGLGSQISQDAGVFVPHPIDNYIKYNQGIRGYGRYMDDSYVIHHDKEYLWYLLENIKRIASSIGIFINERKTQIVNLKHQFTILKTNYTLHDNGSITIRPDSDTFTRERRKLSKQQGLLYNNEITYEDIDKCFLSWKGNILRTLDNHYIEPLKRIDSIYNNLFIETF